MYTSVGAANQKDNLPPKLTDIQIDKLSVNELQKATITVTVTDNDSGVSRVNAGLTLMNEAGKSISVTLYSVNREWDKVVKSNVFQGELKVTSQESGKYYISELRVYDNADNKASYKYDKQKKALVSTDQSFEFSQEINVSNRFETEDILQIIDPPIKFTQPTVYGFTAYIDEKLLADDSMYKDAEIFLICRQIDSYNSLWIPLYNQQWDEASNKYIPLPKNTLKSVTEISQYASNGIYAAYDIMLRTQNDEVYFRAPEYYFKIDKPLNVYQTLFTSSEDMEKELKKIPNKSYVVKYGSMKTPSEFVKAVKNKGLTYIEEVDDAEIVLKDTDITEFVAFNPWCYFDTTNNIDEFKSRMYSPTNLATIDSILTLTQNKNVGLLMFRENGRLPGKSTMRVKLNHNIRKAIGAKDLYVYAYDSTNKRLNLIKPGANPGIDGYIELNLDYLYNLVLSNEKL